MTVPPDSWHAWVRLGVWECWMGALLYFAFGFGMQLLGSAPHRIVTVIDFANCYAAPPVVQPCERIVYRGGVLDLALNAWCGVLMILLGVWLLWELWSAVAPKPITDDFLKLLDDSFGHTWRNPRRWPWARVGWAYGFAIVGVSVAAALGAAISTAVASSAKTPTAHIETSQTFRVLQQ